MARPLMGFLLSATLLYLASLCLLPDGAAGWVTIPSTQRQLLVVPYSESGKSSLNEIRQRGGLIRLFSSRKSSEEPYHSSSIDSSQQATQEPLPMEDNTSLYKMTPAETSSESSSSSSSSHLISASSGDMIPVLDDSALQILSSKNAVSGAPAFIENVLSSYWGPRLILAAIAAIYGTNFALGSLMNDALPAAAVTSCRMSLAAAALLPFLSRISPNVRQRAILCGVFTAAGYVTQSIALTDTDPARVSFLGAAIVLWCPFLEWAVDKIPMGWKDAPQTWIAAVLCLTGVGILELYDPTSVGGVTVLSLDTMGGDILALLQAVAFGTGCFLNAKMIREEPDQVLPVTAMLFAVTAGLSWLWCGVESLLAGAPIFDPVQFLDPSFHTVALAVLWTGLVSTAFNVVVEISALGRMPSSEASVLLASEPVWAALFAAALLGETLKVNDYVGGAFIIGACLVNALVKPSDIQKLFSWSTDQE